MADGQWLGYMWEDPEVMALELRALQWLFGTWLPTSFEVFAKSSPLGQVNSWSGR